MQFKHMLAVIASKYRPIAIVDFARTKGYKREKKEETLDKAFELVGWFKSNANY